MLSIQHHITILLGQLSPAVPVVIAYYLVRRAADMAGLIWAAVLVFLAYVLVNVLPAAILYGSFSLSMLVGGTINLFSTVSMPLAWAALTVLWCFLFYGRGWRPEEARA